MKRNTRLTIITENRIGITEDILRELHCQNIDLISMEVYTKKISLMIEPLHQGRKAQLIYALKSIPDVCQIEEIKLLDFEKAERSLMAIINAVDEGILALDLQNRISRLNPYCEQLFELTEEEVLGQKVETLLGSGSAIANLIHSGKNYDNLECKLEIKGRCIAYVSTGRLIRDDEDEVIGAVASIKDINKVKELISVIGPVEEDPFAELIGDSEAIRKAKRTAEAVAHSHATVMIRGESGSGKELFAQAIHRISQRSGSFVTINCAAIPESLLESELFGYEKGSFTGALQSKKGLFEEADGGTLFLDEVGELPLATQAKLLRVIQDSAVRRIGSTQEKKVDVRIVVATHRNLEDMKRERVFREDLYYRLNVIPIHIPSLRQRPMDIPLLAAHFIGRSARRVGKTGLTGGTEFFESLMNYDWPGNVRELQNVIERAVILCEGSALSRSDLHIGEEVTQSIEKSSALKSTHELSPLTETMDAYEREIISEALSHGQSYRATAKALGISHTTLMNKVSKYQLRL